MENHHHEIVQQQVGFRLLPPVEWTPGVGEAMRMLPLISVKFQTRHFQAFFSASPTLHNPLDDPFALTLITHTASEPFSPLPPRYFNPSTLCYYDLSTMLSALDLDLDQATRDTVIAKMIDAVCENSPPPGSVIALTGEISTMTEHFYFHDTEVSARLLFLTEEEEEEIANNNNNNNNNMVGAASHAVEEMPVVVVGKEDEECSICLEEIPRNSEATRMPCSHEFHDHCIKRWLRSSHCCPLCRYEMPT